MTGIERREMLLGLGTLAVPMSGCVEEQTEEKSGESTVSLSNEATSSNSDRDVTQICHRGCKDEYPENTVLAAKKAAQHVGMIEIDVRRCKSGELVVFHDETLDRVTDATGAVSNTKWSKLKKLKVDGSNQGIPLLSDLLSAVPSDTTVNIELKETWIADDLLSITKEVENDILYSSFYAEALRELRVRNEDIDLAYLVYENPNMVLDLADQLGCVAVNPSVDIALNTDFVEKAHRHGFEVNVWVAEKPETAKKLVKKDVDGVFVNRWGMI